MVVNIGDVVSTLRTLKKLFAEMKESRQNCESVRLHLKEICKDIEKLSNPSKEVERYKVILGEFQKLLEAYRAKPRYQQRLQYQTMLRELERIEQEINRLFQSINLDTAARVGKIEERTQQWEANKSAQMAMTMETHQMLRALQAGQAQKCTCTLLSTRNQPKRIKQRIKPRILQREMPPALERASRASMPQWFIAAQHVEFDRKALGVGSYGSVHIGALHRAVKVVVKQLLSWNHEMANRSCAKENFEREISTWRLMDHPHVLRMHGACHLASPPFIVCEDATNGDLTAYLARSESNNRRVWRLLYGAALGLQHIHQKRIVHGNLKLSNILVDADGEAKISDFGLRAVREMVGESMPRLRQSHFVERWRAPECSNGEISFASDVYSFAICIVEALTGKQVGSGILDNSEDLRDDARTLVLSMMKDDPNERIPVSQVVEWLEVFAHVERMDTSVMKGTRSSGNQQGSFRCIFCSAAIASKSAKCLSCSGRTTSDTIPNLTKRDFEAKPRRTTQEKATKVPENMASEALTPGDTTPEVESASIQQKLTLLKRPKAPVDRSYVVDDWVRCEPKGGTGYYALELAKFKKHQLPVKFALNCRSCNLEVRNGLFHGVERPRNCRVCGELFCSACLSSVPLPDTFGSVKDRNCCDKCQKDLKEEKIATADDVFHKRNERIAWFHESIAQKRISRDEVALEALTSAGLYLEMYKGTYQTEDVAVSILPRSYYAGLGADWFLNNVVQAAKLNHPRIVKFLGVAWNSLDDLCAVCEFVSGGSLRMLLSKRKESRRSKGFNKFKVRIALQVAQAIAFMHSLHIEHNDIRPENIMLTGKLNAKLAGFHRNPTVKSRKSSDIWLAEVHGGYPDDGALPWKSPELLQGPTFFLTEFGKADMFAFGVLLSELDMHELKYSSGTIPNKIQGGDAFRLKMNGKMEPQFSAEKAQAHHDRFIGSMAEVVTALARACVCISPSSRPTAANTVSTLERALRMP